MLHGKGQPPICVGAIYQPPSTSDDTIREVHYVLKEIRTEHKPLGYIIAGDFNLPHINWQEMAVPPGSRDKKSCEGLLDLADDFQLHQMVDSPTRGTNTLDLFFTTWPGLVINTQTGPGISDHETVIVDHDIKASINRSAPQTVYQYGKAEWDAINQDLESFASEYLDTDPFARSITTNWMTIKCRLLSVMEKHIPHITIKPNNNLPYITRSIKRDIRRKNRAHTKAKRFNKPKDWVRYCRIRKEVNHKLTQAYWEYLNGIIDPETDTNSKKFYRFIKSMRNDNFGVGTLRANGIFSATNKEKTSMLNAQFKSVFTEERLEETPTMNTPRGPTLPDIVIQPNRVRKLLENLNPSKAAGADCIPARILKTCPTHIAPVLAQSLRSLTKPFLMIGDQQTSHPSSRRETEANQRTTDQYRAPQ